MCMLEYKHIEEKKKKPDQIEHYTHSKTIDINTYDEI